MDADRMEQLADVLFESVRVYLDSKMAEITTRLESVERAFFAKADAGRFADKEEIAARFESDVAPLRHAVAALKDDVAAKPGLDLIRAEQATIASRTASELFATLRVPEDGKSVKIDDVRPILELMVAALPPALPGAPGKNVEPSEIAAEVARQIALVPPPANGESVDLGAIFSEIGAAVTRAVEALPKPKNGDSVTVEDVRPIIEKAIADAVAAIPPPEPGKSVTVDELRPVLAEMVAAIPPAQPGKSVTLEDVRPVLAKLVAGLPPAEPGKSITVDDVRPLLREMVDSLPPAEPGKSVTIEDVQPLVDKAFAALPEPEKGEPGTSVDPQVVATMVQEEVRKAVAEIPEPKDGESVHPDTVRLMVLDTVAEAVEKAVAAMPPIAPERVDMEEVRRLLTDEVTRSLATWERPKDGLGFDDMTMDLKEDGRTMVLRYSRGSEEKSFEIIAPWQIYRGVYKSGQRYSKGDTVTYAGSQWIAIRDTETVPPKSPDWQLAVKSGRDKDA